ncbi:hypothetical protein AHAS_Ahas05G0060500 [Arachis hypogaea]
MMEELNKRISNLEERIAKEESDKKQIIIREEKEARNVVEKVCKEKSVELKQIQDKKSAAERLGGCRIMLGVIRRRVASSSPYPMLLSQSVRKFYSGSSASARISSIVEKEMVLTIIFNFVEHVSFFSGHYGNVRNFSHMTPGCWVNLKSMRYLSYILMFIYLIIFPCFLPHIVIETVLINLLLCMEVFCQEATMQTWRRPFSSDSGDNVDVVVPPLAESIADRTLAKFLKRPGDSVAVDEPIVQIEKDKVIWGNMQIFINDFVPMTHPMAVTNCNIEMESLISDQNISIATLAITTLLKTGNESSVDHLMKQITNFMFDIADEFKIVVVEAIISLCLKFPLKYRSLMNFLSNILREEGGFDYKIAIESGYSIILSSLKIVNSLICPHRVHLENATVRASAVSTLAKFGAAVDGLKVLLGSVY